jgi:hypothetical protein
MRPSGLPVLKTNVSAAADNGITAAANVSAALPVRAFAAIPVLEGMDASSVIIFLRRLEDKELTMRICQFINCQQSEGKKLHDGCDNF